MRPVTALTLILVLVATSPDVVDAQTPPRGERQRVEAAQERRAQLERQVRQRFMSQAAERLQLDPAQRDRLDELLRTGAEARRTLAQESRQVRMRLLRSVAAEDTAAATYQPLLDDLATLREREHALERREAAALAEFLDARQQAQFMVLRMQLNERVRGIRSGRAGERTGQPRQPPG